jgi:hypothetical protein
MTLLGDPVLDGGREFILKEKTGRSPDIVAAVKLTLFLNEFGRRELVKFKVNPCITLQTLYDQVMANQHWGLKMMFVPLMEKSSWSQSAQWFAFLTQV